jgi:hypothetical protein
MLVGKRAVVLFREEHEQEENCHHVCHRDKLLGDGREMTIKDNREQFSKKEVPYRHQGNNDDADACVLPGSAEVVAEILAEPLEIEYITHG